MAALERQKLRRGAAGTAFDAKRRTAQTASPTDPRATLLLEMQQALGNQAVQRLAPRPPAVGAQPVPPAGVVPPGQGPLPAAAQGLRTPVRADWPAEPSEVDRGELAIYDESVLPGPPRGLADFPGPARARTPPVESFQDTPSGQSAANVGSSALR